MKAFNQVKEKGLMLRSCETRVSGFNRFTWNTGRFNTPQGGVLVERSVSCAGLGSVSLQHGIPRTCVSAHVRVQS
jgi:hypothetical protein